SLPHQRCDSPHFFGIDRESRAPHNRQESLAKLFHRQSANVLRIQPHRLWIKRLLRGCCRLLEIHYCVGSINTLQRERFHQLLQAQLFPIIFRRPPEQAQKIDKSLGQEPCIPISRNAHPWPVTTLRKLGAIRRNQQRQMCKLRQFGPCALEDKYMLKRVGEMILSTNDVIDT